MFNIHPTRIASQSGDRAFLSSDVIPNPQPMRRRNARTISSYRANILLKTRMKNNAEITHYAIQNKLVD
jgi:hypothetical protein